MRQWVWGVSLGLALLGCSSEDEKSTQDVLVDTADTSGTVNDTQMSDTSPVGEDAGPGWDVPPDCDSTVDADFDGYHACEDCADTIGNIFPGAAELCDGQDNNCDGRIDEDFDTDGDGFAPCTPDPLLADCDDTNPRRFPGAFEVCCNDVDEDCNGYAETECPCCDRNDWDGDGVSECESDCEPEVSTAYPGAPEVCDGVDSDCSMLTRKNCGEGEPCDANGNGDFTDDQDGCQDGLSCTCVDDACTCQP